MECQARTDLPNAATRNVLVREGKLESGAPHLWRGPEFLNAYGARGIGVRAGRIGVREVQLGECSGPRAPSRDPEARRPTARWEARLAKRLKRMKRLKPQVSLPTAGAGSGRGTRPWLLKVWVLHSLPETGD